jgi:hypothetical protein
VVSDDTSSDGSEGALADLLRHDLIQGRRHAGAHRTLSGRVALSHVAGARLCTPPTIAWFCRLPNDVT